MSSTVMISSKPLLGYAINTSIFETIIDAIRPYFTEEQQDCMKQIYGIHDDWHREYIDLYDVNANCFNLFVQYCEKAKQEFSSTEEARKIEADLKNSYPKGQHWMQVLYSEWDGIITDLKKDPRYKQK